MLHQSEVSFFKVGARMRAYKKSYTFLAKEWERKNEMGIGLLTAHSKPLKTI